MKKAIKTTRYRMIRKEYDDGSIIEYWFPRHKISHERRVIQPASNAGEGAKEGSDHEEGNSQKT
jgi:hypothetical protein